MKKNALLTSLLLALSSTATVAGAQITDKNQPVQVLNLADEVGLRADFVELSTSPQNSVERELIEVRTVRHLWRTAFELERILTEIEEEASYVNSVIDRAEGRKFMLANSIDAANFLSTSIIALVGNCIFIPAPPPRPKVPNILFSTANGISTGMSLVSLMVLRDKKVQLHFGKESMLAPLFDSDFAPDHSSTVWRFLVNRSQEKTSSSREQLITAWHNDSGHGSTENIVVTCGLRKEPTFVSLSRLKIRARMLEELRMELLKMCRVLSDLGHSI